MRYDAIILAGGRGSRLGGRDKAQLPLAGSPLIDRPLQAARDAERIVLVGPESLRRDGVLVTRETPAGGGPAAGTAAGLEALTERSSSHWVLLLSCDLPLASAGVALLLAHVTSAEAHVASAEADTASAEAVDGYCLRDSHGRRHWLLGLYRSASLRDAVRAADDTTDMSMKRLLRGLTLRDVPDTENATDDLDTWADHAAWTERLEKNQ